MAQFQYKARRRTGGLVEGTLDVADRSAAVTQLEKLGLFPVAVTAARGGAAKAAIPVAAGAGGRFKAILPASIQAQLQRRRKPKLQELATFTQQLANLLHAGMPLTMALQSMTSLSSKGIPAEVAKQLKQDVTEGRSLSDAMGRQSTVFPALVVNMVRAGEKSGALEEVLRRQASHFERFADVQSKFKSALIYPTIVLCVGIGLVVFFMTALLPKFLPLFESLPGFELPATTKFLINTSHFLTHWWWVLVMVVVGLGLLFVRYRKTVAGRKTLDRFKLKMPIFGPVVRLNLFGQFARTLGTLLRNGVPVLEALRITEQVLPNVIVGEAIAQTREAVTDGKTLAQPLAKSGIFPQLMLDLLRIGEETGDIPASLENVAETYERELTLGLRAMTNLIEPVMIVGIAILVGFLLVSVMSAMAAITQNLQR
ncbi:MAG TPA: type II secretion system F family protein [Verrucomicrobiota bacterium]|nr:type II secretion system F family protein [Verrucomicrobiota bacterium]